MNTEDTLRGVIKQAEQALCVAIDWLADKGVPFDHPEAVRIRKIREICEKHSS